MSNYESFIKPLSQLINYEKIVEKAQSISIDEVFIYLAKYNIFVKPLPEVDLYVARDYESKYRDYVKVSDILLCNKYPSLIAIQQKFGVKIYNERSLRRILTGLWIHEAYKSQISFLIPVKQEVKCVDHNRKIVGIADIVGPNFIIEIKSSKGIRKEHMLQVSSYMQMLNCKIGYLVYPDHVVKITLTNNILAELNRYYKRIRDIYANTEKYIRLQARALEKLFNISINRLIKLLKENT